MSGRILVVNAGSSSMKYQLLEPDSGTIIASGLVERIGESSGGRTRHTVGVRVEERETPVPDAKAAFALMAQAFAEHGPDLAAQPPLAIGHRVVHGGTRFAAATVVDDEVMAALHDLTPLAPLHNPANIVGIDAAMALFPGIAQIAVFDTAFHRSLPPEAFTYAVPREWRDVHGVRRYGFHGTSHAYVSERCATLHGGTGLGIVVLHLGNGASACAVLDGRSVETSMGLTPLEGLVMGTRSGDLDPAIPFHLARAAGLSLDALDAALNRSSGLLGLTGVNDFRTVLDRAENGDEDCLLAFDVVVHRLVKSPNGVGLVAPGLEVLLVDLAARKHQRTGGEVDLVVAHHHEDFHAALRAAVLTRLGVFGVELDKDANATAQGEAKVTTPASRVAAYVIATHEELQIARECASVLAHPAP